MRKSVLLAMVVAIALSPPILAQPPGAQLTGLDPGFFSAYSQKVEQISLRLSDQSVKAITALQHQEQKLRTWVSRRRKQQADLTLDSSFDYNRLLQMVADSGFLFQDRQQVYVPLVDSFRMAIRFIDRMISLEQAHTMLPAVNAKVSRLSEQLTRSEYINQQLTKRYKLLLQQVGADKATGSLRRMRDRLSAYKMQLSSLKTVANKPDQALAQALNKLRMLPAFRSFFQKYSMLSYLIPGRQTIDTYIDPGATDLQTRAQVAAYLTDRMGNGNMVAKALSQEVSSATAQLKVYKDKLSSLGQRDMPPDMEGFNPNTEKSKTFFQRLELGTNFQTVPSSGSWLPTTSDLGVSVGYRLSKKTLLGVGGSWKVGMDKASSAWALSSQGLSLRSFCDIKVKGSFSATGGLEYNYQPLVSTEGITASTGPWRKSGLLGLTKVVSLKSKMFKKTKLQLLVDFFAASSLPRSSLVKFRCGYNF